MTTLKSIAKKENFDIQSNQSISEAIEKMHLNHNGCVVVLEENTPIGILTESDILTLLEKNIDFAQSVGDLARKKVFTATENRPVESAFELLDEHHIRRIVLLDDHLKYCGVVLQEDLYEYIEDDVYKIDLKVKDIIKTTQSLITLDPSATINDALALMQKYKIGSVVIVEKNKPIGIITEKDIVKLTYLQTNLQENICKYMNSPVIGIKTQELVASMIETMKLRKIRRLIVLDENDDFVGILTNRDILKHIKGNYTKILQNKIRHAQEIMNLLPEPLIEVVRSNENKYIVYWMNTKAKKSFGSMLIDQPINKLFYNGDWNTLLDQLESKNQLTRFISTIQGKTFDISGSISRNLNNVYIKLIFKDITNHEEEKTKLQSIIDEEIKKRLDQEYLLMQNSKLATMGEMIGLIAHQWRQPLTQLGGIFMNLDAAYAFDQLDKKYLDEKIALGNQLIKYMSTTIDDFRNFFEPNYKKQEFNINAYIKSAVNIIQASLTSQNIKLQLHENDNMMLVGYPNEFSQVILNLLANSLDAFMLNKISNPQITIKSFSNTQQIQIIVEDNAGGIDSHILDTLFDIYVSSKKDKDGTGLGLYMSKLIIEEKFLGTISAKNSANGAIFTITLPILK